jgi:hypothetical protein
MLNVILLNGIEPFGHNSFKLFSHIFENTTRFKGIKTIFDKLKK